MVSEHYEQVALVRRLRRAGVLFCAIPNGGFRTRREATRLVAEGLEAGAPDLLVFEGPMRGIAIEMKSSKGRVAPKQKTWHEALRSRGWIVVVAYSADEAVEAMAKVGVVV
jgi:dienelactone hydrolase